MAYILKEITVDVAERNLFPAINAKQFDTDSRFLKVRFTNEGNPIEIDPTSSVVINALRSDKQSRSFAGTVNSDDTVTVPVASWMLELDDVVQCDVSIVDSQSRKLSSMSFSIDVESAASAGDTVSEDQNYDLIVNMLGELAAAKQACESATQETADARDAILALLETV